MDGATIPNRPSIPSPEVLHELLNDENADLVARAEVLLAAMDRAPAKIEDDEVCGKVADFVKQFDAAIKKTEGARVAAKEPALAAARAIDGFFTPLRDRLSKARLVLKVRIEEYLRNKAAEEQRRRDEAARIAAEEAKRKEAAALQSIENDIAAIAETKIDEAAEAQTAAAQSAVFASAKPAEMARTRGELGSVATLSTSWAFEITDLTRIPLERLRPYLDQGAIEKALRGYMATLPRPITVEMPGVRFFEKSSASIR